MGQYYDIVTYKDRVYTVYDRSTKVDADAPPKYMLAKLTEHSWIGNDTMESFSNIIYRNKMRVAWVGDYSDDVDSFNIANSDVLTEEKIIDLHAIDMFAEGVPMLLKDFDNAGKILVNHSKRIYIDMDEYIAANTDADGWCMHPLSLLTALGNGLGGGDYHGINMDDIGLWAFDWISFEDKNEFDTTNFEKVEHEFRED